MTTQVTAEMYARVFENHAEGKMIIEDLVRRFCVAGYVPGGREADREQCYRAGRTAVVQHILNQINIAAGADSYVEDETDIHARG